LPGFVIQRAEEDRIRDRNRQHAAEEIALLEQREVDHRVLVGQLPDDEEEREAHHRDDRRDDDRLRRKPDWGR
jgi:hypothetical protein